MAKQQNGLYVTVKAFIETGKDLQRQHEATSAYMQGKQTGDYSNLFAMMEVDEVEAQPRTRRRVEKATVQEVVPDDQMDVEDYNIEAPVEADFNPAKVMTAISRGDSVDREPVDD